MVDQGVSSSGRHEPGKKQFKVLGVGVDAVQIPTVVAQIERWISERISCHFIETVLPACAFSDRVVLRCLIY